MKPSIRKTAKAGKQRGKHRLQRAIARNRPLGTAKTARSQTAKGASRARLSTAIASRIRSHSRPSATAKRSAKKIAKVSVLLGIARANENAALAKVEPNSHAQRALKPGQILVDGIVWSRPSPRSGVRIPLGAHPGNRGPKHRTRRSAQLFGSEYFDQPIELTDFDETETDENLTKPDIDEEIAVLPSSKIDPFRSLSLSELRRAQIEERIAKARKLAAPGVDSEPEPDENVPMFRLAGRRASAGYDGVALCDWDPFN